MVILCPHNLHIFSHQFSYRDKCRALLPSRISVPIMTAAPIKAVTSTPTIKKIILQIGFTEPKNRTIVRTAVGCVQIIAAIIDHLENISLVLSVISVHVFSNYQLRVQLWVCRIPLSLLLQK